FVSPQRFERQMATLLARGFRSLTLDDFAAAVRSGRAPRRSFLLTFDDAYAHVDQAVTPVLLRLRLTAVMFVPVGHLGSTNTWDADHGHRASLYSLPRRPVRGTDSGSTFRLKTAAAGGVVYSVHRWLQDRHAPARQQGAPA